MLQQTGPLRAADAPAIAANGRAQSSRPAHAERSQPSGRNRLVFAAALATLLVLASVLVALVVRNSSGDEEPHPIPAAVDVTQNATPVPDLVSQTLYEGHFAAGELSVTNEDFFVWNRYSLSPGTALKYLKACGAPTIVISFVESGIYNIQAKGPLEVTRTGISETIPPDSKVSLAAGVSLLYLNETGDQFTGFRNQGPEPLVVTEAIWGPKECVEGPPKGMTVIWDSSDNEPALDPDRPVTISLRRVTAAPGVVLSGEGPSGVGWLPTSTRLKERIYVEAGYLELIQQVVNDTGTPTTEGVDQYPVGRIGITFTLDWDMFPADTSILLDNSGDVPLVITVFTVAYADGDPVRASPSVVDS
jgi:hypothetical protein